ncbi:electron transfer flavoprotein subunit beta/FixA family protein [Geomonas sp. Red69]|uniref:Electron transfer flavoprotein subunit beta n=1 Tax=Geomonas diazotrophica TaxID=2843197 RepID=A0ABX8JCU2_9BACT|nr:MULTISPECIES: electron transfer flavoprotein subunit beta/FixA family protein [Geomonas]MBU5637690.1 electron transfer flavoprotein subunit beta/FixA family protein [Geomonas diazotrophica]QWV96229.1 electron transfer flavoprotein subunit beta/FixA family protein [Geomonas nitrogeniifigens]QXE85296.1 electron transfer flavoprotein subunit beta/FixA family protein [Geomonas nitrogeniifigens]
MKILVCVKQVPDMESRFRPDADGVWYAETDLAFRVNEYDEYAIEQAVLLKEQLGGEPEITLLCVGPDRVVEAIKKGLAMGADRAVHVRDQASHLKDPFQIASIIAAYAKGEGFDLIFTGMQSLDRGSSQVGVGIAEMLGYPCATTVVGFEYADGTVTVKRELEGGVKGTVRLKTPALVTCQLGLNQPRYPTLPNIMKAKKKEVSVIPVEQLLQQDARLVMAQFRAPAKKGGGVVLEGDVADQVDRLIGILKDKTAVLR